MTQTLGELPNPRYLTMKLYYHVIASKSLRPYSNLGAGLYAT